jgi:glucosamine-6-phosphate deaminase
MNISNKILSLPLRDLLSQSKINVEILPNAKKVLYHFARSIADEIKANNNAGKPTRLILPVGPVGQFAILVNLCNNEGISWRNVHTFNMDEYCDWQGRLIPIEHPLSFRGFMRRMFFDSLDPDLKIPSSQTHFPDPMNIERFSEEIEVLGGIDTCYGGLGYHGHIGFNEPPNTRWRNIPPEEFKESLTRIVTLAPETIVTNSMRNNGGNPGNFPPMGVTIGLKDILSSRRIRIYCPGGTWKRYIVRMSIFGFETVDYPTTLLQSHPDYKLIIADEVAEPLQPSLL